MKLVKWLEGEWSDGRGPEVLGWMKYFPGSFKIENLHVIGTCGECGFWNENPEDISLRGNTMGKCMRTGRWEEKIYGCIHFEQKEV